MDTRATAILLALILAPISLVAIVAMIRGYDIHLTMTRRRPRRPEE